MCAPTTKTVFVSANPLAAKSSQGYVDVVTAAEMEGRNSWEPAGSAKLQVPQGDASAVGL